MSFAICFDFPELPGEPLFAGWVEGKIRSIGFAPTLASAALFETPQAAENVLANSYGPETSSYGAVVEVES